MVGYQPECRIAECEEPLAKRTRGEYCDDHTCEFEDCGRRRDKTQEGRYCEEHTCNNWFCTNLALSGEDYCDDHDGKLCHISGCHKPKQASDKGNYCKYHTCHHHSCGKSIRSINDDDYYCVDHSCHALSGCNEQAATVGGFCWEHECETLRCHTRNEDGFTYCASHKCQTYLVKCNEHVVDVDVGFCEDHICLSTESCENERFGKWYCTEHTCVEPYCEEEVQLTSWFCVGHGCAWQYNHKHCNKKRVEEEHCEDHGCVSCPKLAYEDSRACEEHKCKEPRCKNERVSDEEYCKDHTCKNSGCD